MNQKILASRLKRNNQAFTLIELMVVVAIIGILATIAIPNFTRQQSKARQSEAKIALSSIYGAEKAFYAEYSAYVTDLDAIGYAPEGVKRFYSIGWASTVSGSLGVSGYSGTGSTGYYDAVNVPSGWYSTCTLATTRSTLPASATGDLQSFTAGANGVIRDGNVCDNWTITDTKTLSNTQVGI